MNRIILGLKEHVRDQYVCTNKSCLTEYMEARKNCSVCGGRCEAQHIYNCHVPHWGQHQIVVIEEMKP